MKPIGKKQTGHRGAHHHRDCAICHPPAKAGRGFDRKMALRQEAVADSAMNEQDSKEASFDRSAPRNC